MVAAEDDVDDDADDAGDEAPAEALEEGVSDELEPESAELELDVELELELEDELELELALPPGALHAAVTNNAPLRARTPTARARRAGRIGDVEANRNMELVLLCWESGDPAPDVGG